MGTVTAASPAGGSAPGWFIAVLFAVWLTILITKLTVGIRRSRAEGERSWWRAFDSAADATFRHPRTDPAALVLTITAGYLLLIAFVARRSPPVSIGLIVLPLVVVAVVGFRRLGRQMRSHDIDDHDQQTPGSEDSRAAD
jgi:Na+/H+ antiporter NhaD/arsenite permease-like protein